MPPFLSSLVFTNLEFDSDHFGTLLGKILKHVIIIKLNHKKEKYSKNLSQALFCDVSKIIVMIICKQSLRQL